MDTIAAKTKENSYNPLLATLKLQLKPNEENPETSAQKTNLKQRKSPCPRT